MTDELQINDLVYVNGLKGFIIDSNIYNGAFMYTVTFESGFTNIYPPEMTFKRHMHCRVCNRRVDPDTDICDYCKQDLKEDDIIGHSFYLYIIADNSYQHPTHIMKHDIIDATNEFVSSIFKVRTSVLNLNIHTVGLTKNIHGKKAVIPSTLLECYLVRKALRFKIEPIFFGDENDKKE